MGITRDVNTQHAHQLEEPCRKRHQADGHDPSHKHVRKRNLASSHEEDNTNHKKGTDDEAIAAINRKRAARGIQLSGSGSGVNDTL